MDLELVVVRRLDIAVEPYGRPYSEYPDIMKIHIMEDDDGNVYVWRTLAEKMAEGRTYKVRGTVKEHGEYNGTKQTVLTRCKVTCAACDTNDYYHGKDGEYICYGCNMLEKAERMGAE
jgi:hypothetical protein